MNWERFEQLAVAARSEPAPAVDVRSAVLVALAERSQPAPAGVDPLAIFCAGLSLAAAAIALALILPGWDTVGDVLVTCLNPLTMVLQ